MTVRLTDVKDLERDLKLGIGNNLVFNAFFANSGVPHAVLFAEAFRQFPFSRVPFRIVPGDAVRNIGRAVRYHPVFEPAGTNVNFVEIAGPGHIRVRTYERGVEEETLACGTGAAASAIVASEITKAGPPPIRVEWPAEPCGWTSGRTDRYSSPSGSGGPWNGSSRGKLKDDERMTNR